jgi:hypothetical protein
MENQNSHSQGKNSRIILSVYIAICAILILIILLAPFQHAGYGVQGGEIYLKPPASISQ